MPEKTLDYQRLSPVADRVRAALQRSEWWLLFSSIASMLIALLAMLIPAAILNGIIQYILVKVGVPLPGAMTFLLMLAILVPLLFWFERRTHGEFFLEEMRSQGQSLSDRPASYGEWELRRSGATAAAYVEIALWGPRLWRENFARLSYRRKLGPPDFARTTAIIHSLFAARDGMPVTDLLAGGESLDVLRRNLLYLRLIEWLDLSADGKRVWLLSDRLKLIGRAV